MVEQLDRLVWCDIETMGLEPTMHPIMEVGFVITDLDLDIIDDFDICIWDSPAYEKFWEGRAIEYVQKMHEKSGLLEACQAIGVEPIEAEKKINDFLEGYGVKDRQEPLCGSSVSFDRSFLLTQFPSIEKRFHYRNIDVSSIKEVCKRYNPRVYQLLEENTKKQELHRSLHDLGDTIGEFKYYLQEFLIDAVSDLSA
jgi:oligoribonuclease